MKKFLSLCLCCLMLLSMLSISASAEYEKENNSIYFYNKLASYEQTIYDAILESRAGLDSRQKGVIEIKFDSKNTLEGFNGVDALHKDITNSTIAAMSSFIEDHPEFFWVGNFSYSFKTRKNGLANYLSSLTLTLNSPYSWLETEATYNEIMDAARAFKVSGSTTYEKVKSIHDGLCKMLTYADEEYFSLPKTFSVEGALLPPHNCVCEGYAESFKLICELNNIECISVVGLSAQPQYILGIFQLGNPGAHKWNYVKMDDGKWYGIDVTWDDQPNKIYYDFFLSGSNTVAKSFGEETFSSNHMPTGKIFEADYQLKYPTLSKTAYSAPSTQPEVEKNKLGDTNLDGKVTVVDAKWILQAVAGSRSLNSNQKGNADVNKDGKITVVDAKWILQAVAGNRTLK